jgi:hypothetical protein
MVRDEIRMDRDKIFSLFAEATGESTERQCHWLEGAKLTARLIGILTPFLSHLIATIRFRNGGAFAHIHISAENTNSGNSDNEEDHVEGSHVDLVWFGLDG